jgi:hypothetical protein
VLVRKVHLPSMEDEDAIVLPAGAGASMSPHQRQEH